MDHASLFTEVVHYYLPKLYITIYRNCTLLFTNYRTLIFTDYITALNKTEVTYEAQKMIKKSATVITDGKRCYRGLQDICKEHKEIIVKDKTQVSKTFPWVHIAISNAKKKLLGLHHQIKDTYMQNYLSEFCYKFNRRHFGQKLFDRLLVAAMDGAWYENKPNYG